MRIKLHAHQDAMVEGVRSNFRRKIRRVLVQSPTGSGKTVMAASIMQSALKNEKVVWFVVHRRELIKQSSRTADLFDIPYGTICPGYAPDVRKNAQIAMVGTLARRMDRYPNPDLILVDEAHHSPAGTWRRVLERNSKAYMIGFTATPVRHDKKGLREQYDVMVRGPEPSWLIDNEFLSPYRAFSPDGADLSQVGVRGGDYIPEQASAAVNKPQITGDAIHHYQEHAAGKRMIVFAANIEHSMSIAKAYRTAGIPAEHVDGETPEAEREAIIARFAAGETLVMSNVALFGEGFDVPDAVAVQLLRPTLSVALYLQMVGRVLRYVKGKVAIILDHVGAIDMHGLPDQVREWSLDGVQKQPKKSADSEPEFFVVRCKACFEWMEPTRVCIFCGAPFSVAIRKRFLPVVPGTLQEIFRRELRDDAQAEFQAARSHLDSLAHLYPGEPQVGIPYIENAEWSDAYQEYLMAQENMEIIRKSLRTGAEVWAENAALKRAALARLPEARNLRDFQLIAKEAGYASGWAWHQFQNYQQEQESKQQAFVAELESILSSMGGETSGVTYAPS